MARPTELSLIEAFTARLPLRGEGVRVSVGDDAAVLAPPRGEELVATVDEVVAGVHFDRRFTPFDVGWKALAVNLSDLAAMGARPLWALVALALPARDAARAPAIARGLGACARAHGIAVVGGNVSRARALSIAVTVVGAVPRGRALLRAGARAGDLVCVTGTLGDAALGLAPRAAPALARRQRRPTPRLAAGRALAPLAHAGIDVSDGLVRDLGHVCRASGVRAALELEAIPRSAAYRRATRGAAEPWAAALAGGEDYELVLAIPSARLARARTAARRAGVPLTVIGRFVHGGAGHAPVTVLDAAGRKVAVPRGHDHLA
ncbi:MAG: thiamine-phosphate kinase [Anaeromyxobacter sp.]